MKTTSTFSSKKKITVAALSLVMGAAIAQDGGEIKAFAGGVSSGYAEGNGTEALFASPLSIAQDMEGNVLVADRLNYRIRKVTAAADVTTYAGIGYQGVLDGPLNQSAFFDPSWIGADPISGNIYVLDNSADEGRILRKIENGTVTTIAGVAGYGDGEILNNPGTGEDIVFYTPQFGEPKDIAVMDGIVYVPGKFSILKVIPGNDKASTHVSILAGTNYNPGSADGTGTNARFEWLNDVIAGKDENLYVGDGLSFTASSIKRVTPAGEVTTLYTFPEGEAVSAMAAKSETEIYFLKTGVNTSIYLLNLTDNSVHEILLTAGYFPFENIEIPVDLNQVADMEILPNGNIITVSEYDLSLKMIEFTGLGIAEIRNLEEVTILQNPVKDELLLSKNAKKAEIYSFDGKLLSTFKGKNHNISLLPKGIYSLIGTLENGNSFVTKFIKK